MSKISVSTLITIGVLVCGFIATWSVNNYRLDNVEKRVAKNEIEISEQKVRAKEFLRVYERKESLDESINEEVARMRELLEYLRRKIESQR